jgi:hypothetical protein
MTEPTDEPDDLNEWMAGPSSRRPNRTNLLSMAKVVTGITHARTGLIGLGTLTTALLGILAFVYIINPAWKPDPEGSGEVLEVELMYSAEPVGEYCKQYILSCDTYNASQLQQLGTVYNVKVRAKGYNGKRLSLEWTIRETGTLRRVDDKEYQDTLGWPDGGYAPSHDDDLNVLEIWVPFPRDPGEYEITLTLYDQDLHRLDTAIGPPFTVS